MNDVPSLFSHSSSTTALWTWDNTADRVVEHQSTFPISDVIGIHVKLETRSYTEAIPPGEMKFYNDLFKNRTSVINRIEGMMSLEGEDAYNKHVDMFRSDKNEVVFFVTKRRYWELLYLSQGKRYPRPCRRRSKARMAREWREYGSI